jgi:hypothetical protein
MIKAIIIFFSYLSFLLLGIYNSDTVLVENNTPAVLVPGTRSLVEVNIRKGDVQGFSKLELTLPDGFIATPGDIKGASFTFSGDKAKFVWMNLPDESIFKVTYYLESESGVEGAYEVKGTFSYVRENIREDIYVPTRTIVVKQADAIAQQQASVAAVDELNADSPVVRVEQPVLEMSCERRIERVSDNEYLVKLKVNNNRISGFGKILEVLPDNCNTNRDNDGGAVITQDANSIKFVWFEVPTAPSFEISYRVMCISDGTVPVIRGQLSYTENGNPFTVDVVQMDAPADLQGTQTASSGGNQTSTADSSSAAAGSSVANVEQESNVQTTNNTQQTTGTQEANTAANTGSNAANTGDGKTTTSSTQGNASGAATAMNSTSNSSDSAQQTAQSTPEKKEKVTEKTAKKERATTSSDVKASKQNDAVAAVKSGLSPDKGITYKVQILAAHRVVDKTYLKKKFSFEEDYNIEHHNGWVKYTTGSYAQYKDARDARVKIKSESEKLPGPFVTAYNDGERITVQEALLISKQLWYK